VSLGTVTQIAVESWVLRMTILTAFNRYRKLGQIFHVVRKGWEGYYDSSLLLSLFNDDFSTTFFKRDVASTGRMVVNSKFRIM